MRGPRRPHAPGCRPHDLHPRPPAGNGTRLPDEPSPPRTVLVQTGVSSGPRNPRLVGAGLNCIVVVRFVVVVESQLSRTRTRRSVGHPQATPTPTANRKAGRRGNFSGPHGACVVVVPLPTLLLTPRLGRSVPWQLAIFWCVCGEENTLAAPQKKRRHCNAVRGVGRRPPLPFRLSRLRGAPHSLQRVLRHLRTHPAPPPVPFTVQSASERASERIMSGVEIDQEVDKFILRLKRRCVPLPRVELWW